MATATALTHPRKAAQTTQFFPHIATFKGTTATGKQTTLFSSPCHYEGAIGGESAEFEAEAPTNDKILLPAWRPEITKKQLVVVLIDGVEKRFNVLDSVPEGTPPSRTLVSITPKP